DLYLGGETLHIGTNTGDEATFSYNTTTNSTIIKNAVDSTTGLLVQNAAGTNLLTANTTNQVITITGSGPPSVLSLAAGANTGGALRGDTTYYYKYSAIVGGNETAPSAEASFAPTSFTPLSAPTAPSAALAAGAGM